MAVGLGHRVGWRSRCVNLRDQRRMVGVASGREMLPAHHETATEERKCSTVPAQGCFKCRFPLLWTAGQVSDEVKTAA